MAEDSPQNSSGSQEASEVLSGITNEKTNSSTRENTTLDKKQCREKYDLTVIVPHGIGRQKPGDTFALMYKSISDNFNDHPMENCDSNCKNTPHVIKKFWSDYNTEKDDENNFGNIRKIKNVLVGVDLKIPQGENRYRYVALRESYWHPIKDNEEATKSWEATKSEEPAPWYKMFLGVIQIFLLKILQFRLSTISFILVTSWILRFSGFNNEYNIPQGIDTEGWKKLQPFVSMFVNSGLFPYLIIVLPALIIFPAISLYIQIKSCSSGAASRQANKVLGDIKEALNQSREVMIVAHSMGGYLSYESLRNEGILKYANRVDGTRKNVSLVGLGSGLGPMMIIRKVKGMNLWDNMRLVILLSIFFFLYSIAWTSLLINLMLWVYYPPGGTGAFVLGFSNHKIMLVSNFFREDLAGTHPSNIVFKSILFLILMRIFMSFIVRPFYSEFAIEEWKSISFLHRELYYSSDIVGNTSRFIYPKSFGQELLGDPILDVKESLGWRIVSKRFIYSHNLGYYFQNNRLVNFLWSSISSGINPKDYTSKDSKPRKLQVVYVMGFFVALCVSYLIYANNRLNFTASYSHGHYSIWVIFNPVAVHIYLPQILSLLPLILASCWIVYFCTYFIFSVFLYIVSSRGQSRDMPHVAPTLLDEKIFKTYALVQLVAISFISYFVSTWIIDFIKSLLSYIPYVAYGIFDFLGKHFWAIEITLICLIPLPILIWKVKEVVKRRFGK